MNFTKELLVRVKEEVDRTKVLTLFQNSMESRSYKIREMAALEVGGVASVLGGEIFISQLLETYMSLLKDNNAEVRKNAIKQLTELSKFHKRSSCRNCSHFCQHWLLIIVL